MTKLEITMAEAKIKAAIELSMPTKPQFLISDDDEYQEQLELRWWLDEQEEELKRLNKLKGDNK